MKLFLFLFLIISLPVRAEEIKMAVITSEFDQNVMEFFLITDNENKIDSMRYVTILPNGGILEDVTVPAERVMREGATLVIRNGFEAVRLEVDNFDLQTGGVLRVNYLFNAVTGARHNKRLQLNLVGQEFHLFDQAKRVNKMFFVANIVRVFGVVGVKEVQTSFSP